jgi:hypothetical protein
MTLTLTFVPDLCVAILVLFRGQQSHGSLSRRAFCFTVLVDIVVVVLNIAVVVIVSQVNVVEVDDAVDLVHDGVVIVVVDVVDNVIEAMC